MKEGWSEGKNDMPEIDFVVTWVDGRDEAWRRERAAYRLKADGEDDSADDSEERYRDWGLLKYWFRGVEQFAPWVRRVHLITWGHLPDWLNTECRRLHIVRHRDYIPQEYLPVFNSNVLEIHMHRIEGLSERFVYFNDDMFLIREASPEDFFKGGLPCDMLAFQPVVANPRNPVMSHLYLNNALVLSKYFDKRENVRKNPGNYFKPGYPPLYFCYNLLELMFPLYTGFYTVHGPSPFLKSTFLELWEREEKALLETSKNRFRSSSDLTPYLFREWQKLSGNFCPRNVLRNFRYYNLGENQAGLLKTIQGQKCSQICINDGRLKEEGALIGRQLQEAFSAILPQKSVFEK